MPAFSQLSQDKLATCDQRLQRVFAEVIKHRDCTVLCGHRGKEEQDEAFRTGKSKVQFPNSNHNRLPSVAADVVPYPIDWHDPAYFTHFAGFVLGVAATMGIRLRWGGDWNQNGKTKDESFFDGPHFELMD
jgi:hypothetical protein